MPRLGELCLEGSFTLIAEFLLVKEVSARASPNSRDKWLACRQAPYQARVADRIPLFLRVPQALRFCEVDGGRREPARPRCGLVSRSNSPVAEHSG